MRLRPSCQQRQKDHKCECRLWFVGRDQCCSKVTLHNWIGFNRIYPVQGVVTRGLYLDCDWCLDQDFLCGYFGTNA